MMPCQKKFSPSRAAKGYPNWKLGAKGGHDVMATRGDWKLGANGCRGASRSDERFGANSLMTTLRRGLLLSGGLRTSRIQDPFISII